LTAVLHGPHLGTKRVNRLGPAMSVIGSDWKWRHRGQNDAKDPNRICDTQYGRTFARYALRHLYKPLIASQPRRSSAAAGDITAIRLF
jgi:hypothetical protein